MIDASEWIGEHVKKSRDGMEWLPLDDVKVYLSEIDDELRNFACELNDAGLYDVVDVLYSVGQSLNCLGTEICQ